MTVPSSGPKPLNPANYPRVYPVQTGYLVLSYVFAALIAAVGVAVARVLAAEAGDPAAIAFWVAVASAALLLGAYVAIDARKSRIILTVDAIEVHDLWLRAPKRIERADIAGVRAQAAGKGPAYLVLIPRDGDRKTIRFQQAYTTDLAFVDWMRGLPDLDRAERERSEEAIVSDASLGPSREARLTRLTRARAQARWITRAAIAACAWALYSPRPYVLVCVVLAAMPWLAIIVARRSDGLWRLAQVKKDAHANITLALMFPGFLLAFRALFDVNLLRWQGIVVPAAVIATVLFIAARRVDPSLAYPNIDQVFLMLLVACAYGFGAASLADRLFDRSPREQYRARVEERYDASSRNTSGNRRIVIGPWGPDPQAALLYVSRTFHDSVRVGDSVCVVLGRGAIGAPWYEVEHCAR